MTHLSSPHHHEHDSPHRLSAHHNATDPRRLSVLAWPAWRRVLAVLPLVLTLWLAVWWAHMGATPW